MSRLLRTLLFAVAGLIGLAALALGLLATPPGRSVLAWAIERAASGNGLTVAIGRLSGWPPFSFGAESVVLSDQKGAFLEIDGLSGKLDTGALLSGRLSAKALSAARVAVHRPPELPGGGSRTVLPLVVERLRIEKLDLGAELVGRPASLSVTGGFAAGADGGLSASLTATRSDGRRGSFMARLARASAGAPLAVDLTAEEPADGILVGAIGRQAGPGYRLTAHTGFAAGVLDGTLSLASEGDARFDGKFRLAANRLTMTGEGDLADLVPPALAGLLGGKIGLAVDAEWTGGEAMKIVIHDGRMTTGSVKAVLSGRFGGPETDLSFRVEAARPGGGKLDLPVAGDTPVGLDSLALSGRAVPRDGGVRFDIVGHVGGLAVGEFSAPGVGLSLAIEADGKDPLADESLPFALRVEGDALDTPGGRVAATSTAPLLLTAEGTLDLGALSAEIVADLAIAGGKLGFKGSLSSAGAAGAASAAFADLSPLAPLFDRPLGGAIAATAEGRFFGPDGFSLDIAGKATRLAPGDVLLAKLLADEATFSGTVAGDRSGAFALTKLSIATGAASATGDFTLRPETIEGKFAGQIADLSLLAAESEGAASFSASIGGARLRPRLDGTAKIESGRLLGEAVENATVHVEGAPTEEGWSGAFALDGRFAGRPLTGRAKATLDTGRLAFPEVDLAIAENRVTGSLERTPDGLFSGALSVDAPNLQTLAALVLVEAAGAVRANVKLTPDGSRQSVAVAFKGSNVSVPGVIADEAEGQVRIADALATPLVQGNIAARGVGIGTLRFERADLAASVEDGATRFEAAVKNADMDLKGSARFSADADARVVRVEQLTGTAYGFPVKLGAPAEVRIVGDSARLAAAGFALGGGRLTVEGGLAPGLDLSVVADGVAASVANRFARGLDADGSVSGRATVTEAGGATRIAWQATWSGFRVGATRAAGLPVLGLAARGVASTSATSLDAKLTGAGISLAIAGQIPFAGDRLKLKAEGTAPLALLALLSASEMRLAGTANLNLDVTGSSKAPAIAGVIDLAGATVADPATGLGVAGASGRIRLNGRTATVERFSGRLLQGGEISVAGSVGLDAGAGLPANLTLSIVNGRYADGAAVNASFDADLKVSGPILSDPLVSGRLDLGRTEILLPDKIGGPATAIEVRHVNADAGFVPPKAAGSSDRARGISGGGGVRLDIAIGNRGGIFVRGFGLDAEMGGSLDLRGTSGSPLAVGAFDLVRGRLEVLGRRFEITRGRLTFSGDLVPIVDFAASTNSADVTVTVLVTGPASDPEIHFTSTPQLPEEEVLSRLLFNRSLGALSPFQAAQLVDSVAQLSGAVGRGNGLFDRVRRATGLDDLDIRQNDAGGTTFGIGQRLGDNLRVGVEQDTEAGNGKVTIDLDITKQLKARGEAGQDGSGKLGITFEREY